LRLITRQSAFSERLGREIEEVRRYGRGLALLYIDLDNFKDVNDTLDQAVGEALSR
jgi:diguanylate cyclase